MNFKWGGTGYNVAGVGSSSSKRPIYEDINFFTFFAPQLTQFYFYLYHQPSPSIDIRSLFTSKILPVVVFFIMIIGNREFGKTTLLYRNKNIRKRK